METIRRGERVKGKVALVAGAGSIAPGQRRLRGQFSQGNRSR